MPNLKNLDISQTLSRVIVLGKIDVIMNEVLSSSPETTCIQNLKVKKKFLLKKQQPASFSNIRRSFPVCELSVILEVWLCLPYIEPDPPRRRAPISLSARNSGNHTNLHEQRPPVDSSGRVASTYSISWLWGQRGPPGPPAIRKEKLLAYTFGNKTPIEKDYDVVKLTLKNKDSPNLKIDIEALVTDQISAANIPSPELDNIPQAVHLENLVLADSPDCQEPYDVVTGKIKHLSKELVAVETIFGWCLQGRNIENQSSLALSVIVQENLISDQLKKFWNLEVSGLIDSKNESDVSENQLMKNFESNIKYDEKAKRYNVGLPWKEVTRKDRPSSQLRIVYDASSHDANSLSLNSLHVGPNLYPEIFHILLRFRQNTVAFTADMKQAFLQIMLNEEVGSSDESQLPSVYRFTRILFGISSSPFFVERNYKTSFEEIFGKLTSPLPSDRTNQTQAFSVCGLDFVGPLYVKNFGELQKSCIVLFTCEVTRAFHLELVSDMNTNSFLLAFRRFLGRRGNCKVIYSDNAKTFLKSKKEIEN
ncbi:integrase catalytic domain-containing protein [Trichonephila clavipes]|nr:integrase catalytic domain-containing protein [Trichonephila clavipes]